MPFYSPAQGRGDRRAPWENGDKIDTTPTGLDNAACATEHPSKSIARETSVPQSLSQIYLHIVYSTKNRVPYLQDKPFRERLHGYLSGICDNLNCPTIIVGGVEDHVHILCRFGKSIAVEELFREMKRDSSKWVKRENPRLAEFHWQAGSGHSLLVPRIAPL